MNTEPIVNKLKLLATPIIGGVLVYFFSLSTNWGIKKNAQLSDLHRRIQALERNDAEIKEDIRNLVRVADGHNDARKKLTIDIAVLKRLLEWTRGKASKPKAKKKETAWNTIHNWLPSEAAKTKIKVLERQLKESKHKKDKATTLQLEKSLNALRHRQEQTTQKDYKK